MLFVIPMYSVPGLLHMMYTKYLCSFMRCHFFYSLYCHPERSMKFAKRTSFGVEGPHVCLHCQEGLKAFSRPTSPVHGENALTCSFRYRRSWGPSTSLVHPFRMKSTSLRMTGLRFPDRLDSVYPNNESGNREQDRGET